MTPPLALENSLVVEQLIVVAHPTAAHDVLATVVNAGALLQGHFLLQGGAHSGHFLRFARIARNEERLEMVARSLLQIATFVPSGDFTVLCPETSGAFLGGTVARLRGARMAIARVDEGRRPVSTLRVGSIEAGSKVVIVNDVVTTGNALSTLVGMAETNGAAVAGIAVFGAIRPEALQAFALRRSIPHAALVHARWPIYDCGLECPGCKNDGPPLPASELN